MYNWAVLRYNDYMTKERRSYGERIREARRAARLSQSELARALGISDRTISSYEKGRNMPPVEKLQKIADETNYSLQFFVGENDPMVQVRRMLIEMNDQLAEIKKLIGTRTKDKRKHSTSAN